jgi:hypothetical protein
LLVQNGQERGRQPEDQAFQEKIIAKQRPGQGTGDRWAMAFKTSASAGG